jgi:molybdate transport system regulatory protein
MAKPASTPIRLHIRLDLDGHRLLGPGKVALLEAVAARGSISAAGRAIGMSYRRAWMLIEAMNVSFDAPVVATQSGGAGGGGAELTEFGREIVTLYRRLESKAEAALAPDLVKLGARLKLQPVT